MILQAIQQVVSGLCNAYPLLGDIESNTPFVVYTADANVLYDKTGICGYEYSVVVSVVDEDISDCLLYSSGVKVCFNTLEGTTTQGTTFDMVHLINEGQRFDEKALCYINDLGYRILTQNI